MGRASGQLVWSKAPRRAWRLMGTRKVTSLIASFDYSLQVGRAQDAPQRLLLVFAGAMYGDWRVVLVGGLSGKQGAATTDQAVDRALERLLGLMQTGRIDQVLAQTLAFARDRRAVAPRN